MCARLISLKSCSSRWEVQWYTAKRCDRDSFASLTSGPRRDTVKITILLTLNVGCEAGGEGVVKGSMKRDMTHFHSEA